MLVKIANSDDPDLSLHCLNIIIFFSGKVCSKLLDVDDFHSFRGL